MMIRGVEEHDLRAALDVANYAYKGNLLFKEGPEPIQGSDNRSWKVQLGVEDIEGPGCRCFVQLSWRGLTLKGQAHLPCSHAYRDFLYAVFERAPRAWVDTASATYNGCRDFVSRRRHVGRGIMSSLFGSTLFCSGCHCSKFPEIEELVPEPYLGEYTFGPDPEIYAGLEHGRKELSRLTRSDP